MSCRLLFAGLMLTGIALKPTAAHAEILEYQIRRLILLNSSCIIVKLARKTDKAQGYIYKGSCDNSSFYPDGIMVHCPLKDDETSCEIKTKSLKFDMLEAMRPKPHEAQ